MKRREPVTLEHEASAANAAQEDPSRDGGAKARGSHPAMARGRSSGDDPLHGNTPPLPAPNAPLSHYKGFSLKNVGRDSKGRVIPYRYSTKVARQISQWTLGGYDENAICVALNMRPGILKQLYGKELAVGSDLAGMDLTSHIMKRAKASDRMAIFVAKAKMGWRDGESRPLDTGGLLSITIHT